MEGNKPKLEAFRLPAAPAYGLIRRGYSPANLPSARYAMAARRAQPAAGKGWHRRRRLAGRAIKPGQGGLKPPCKQHDLTREDLRIDND